jgi:hypothetical protein
MEFLREPTVKANTAANRVLASPNGSSGNMTARALVEADIPNISAAKLTSGTIIDNGATTASPLTLNQANGAYQASGYVYALPGAGTYLLWFNVRSVLWSAAGNAYLVGKLRNTTDSADISSSERLLCFVNTTAQTQVISSLCWLVTVAAAKNIEIYIFRDGSTSWSQSDIASDSYGRTAYGYLRLSR